MSSTRAYGLSPGVCQGTVAGLCPTTDGISMGIKTLVYTMARHRASPRFQLSCSPLSFKRVLGKNNRASTRCMVSVEPFPLRMPDQASLRFLRIAKGYPIGPCEDPTRILKSLYVHSYLHLPTDLAKVFQSEGAVG